VAGTHPQTTTIALADYDKLVALLGEAFDGTAQAGSTLPIYYDEFGVESQIPPAKQQLYTGDEPTTTKPVPEATQAEYYRQAVQLAFCQPNVRGLFLFHAFDETALPAWQSGLYYADDSPKASLAAVRAAMEQSRRGVVAQCPGMRLAVRPKATQRGATLALTCDLDCSYVAQLYRLPGRLLATRRGRAVGGRATVLPLHVPAAQARYRLRVSAVAAVERGPGGDGAAARATRLAFRAWKDQYIAYTFYRVDPAWRRLPVEERQAGKDAFAEVVEEHADRFEHLRAYTTGGRAAGDRFLPLEDRGSLRDAGRARRRAQRDAPRRLARDAVLVSRDDEGVAIHERPARAEDHTAGVAVPRRLPVREGASLVRALGRRPPARDGRSTSRSGARSSPASRTTRRTRSASTTRSS